MARDESGGVLPGVTVVATATGAVAGSVVTSGEGRYSIAVPAGIYVVAAELSGFAPFSSRSDVGRTGSHGDARRDAQAPLYGDTLVVTGSRAPEALRTAPVAVTVLRSAEIETTPATNYSDLLRSVPGVNASSSRLATCKS